MKKFINTSFAIFCLTVSLCAQPLNKMPATEVGGITAKIVNKNLVINWSSDATASDTWEVQASADGKSFTTIGFVLGKSPDEGSELTYKQQVNKLKPGLKYYRVLHVESADRATASTVITISK